MDQTLDEPYRKSDYRTRTVPGYAAKVFEVFMDLIGSTWIAERIASPSKRQNFIFRSYISFVMCEDAMGRYIPRRLWRSQVFLFMGNGPMVGRVSIIALGSPKHLRRVVARVRHRVVELPIDDSLVIFGIDLYRDEMMIILFSGRKMTSP